MNEQTKYRTITREQFLFHEMRIVAKLLAEEKTDEQVKQEVIENNLFQYPTEKMLGNICTVCLARFNAVDNKNEFVNIVSSSNSDVAKQACLFLMMNYYRLVWDFMITVIGEKYRVKDMTFTKVDMNSFFTRLEEQNDTVASWSDLTITKCKQVLKKTLVEVGYLDNTRSEVLNMIILDLSLKEAITRSRNTKALVAFGCLKETL